MVFGTSGHRGPAFRVGFNEGHALAVTQAIRRYRKAHAIDGPLILDRDTHALSEHARASALGVLAGDGVDVMIADGEEYTPTSGVSPAIPTYNRGRKAGLAGGIAIMPARTISRYLEDMVGRSEHVELSMVIKDTAPHFMPAAREQERKMRSRPRI